MYKYLEISFINFYLTGFEPLSHTLTLSQVHHS